MNKEQKILAGVNSPIIEAVLLEKWHFSTMMEALERLEHMRQLFMVQAKAPHPEEVRLWIKGYALTPQEKKEGRTGNYALITPQEKDDGFTLHATKLDVEVKKHPHRQRPKQKHPDWGYRILRQVKKGQRYASLESAIDALETLVKDFPATSVMASAKAYTVVYNKSSGIPVPLQRIVLSVEVLPDGEFTIKWKPNTFKRKPKDERHCVATQQKQQNLGKFTALVSERQKRSA